MLRHMPILALITACATLSLLGCGEDFNATQTGTARVMLSRTSSDSGGLAAPIIATAPVTLDMVTSIDVTVTEVRALPLGEDDEDDGSWVVLDVVGNGDIDLMNLPGPGESGIVIAASTVAAGPYSNLRFFFDAATITLNTEVTINSLTFEAGVPYDLTIPSGLQTGIKVPTGGFDVPAGGADEVTIVFHDAASVQTVTATGHGLQMSPVLTETNGR